MAQGVRDVAALPDPIGETLAEWTKSQWPADPQSARASGRDRNHLRVAAQRTVDTAVLALKTGNAIVLRGGKEAARSNQRLVEI